MRQLVSLYDEMESPEKRNEAETRFHFIDMLLFDCLGWDKADCTVEDRVGATIADYTLSAPRRALIVEAKRGEVAFRLPASNESNRIWKIATFKKLAPDVYAAIEQAIGYTIQRGTPFGAVTNGHQIIAFIGSRTDGVEPIGGRAIVFHSLHDMLKSFRELWDTLSKPAIGQRRLQIALQVETSHSPPAKLATTLTHYPGLKRRNKLQVQLETIAQYLFEELLDHHGQVAFLEACYCRSAPLAEYAQVSKNILKARYSKLFEERVSGPQLEPASDASGVRSDEISRVAPGRPLLLLGDVGVGKSLFLSHFVKIEAAEIIADSIYIYIDFLRMPTLRVASLWGHVTQEVAAQLSDRYDIDVHSDDFVRSVYYRELERFARTPAGRLKGVDDASYERERVKYLSNYTDDPRRHLQSAMRAVQLGRRRPITLMLDNIDHHVPEFQEEVFRIAEHIADAWQITVFVAMRPSTFFQSKKRGVIAAYQPRAFTVDPPLVSDVVRKRLEYIEVLLSTGCDHVLSEILQAVPSLNDYLNVVSRSFRSNVELYECVENLCGGNIRKALEYVQKFLGSGHVDTEDILQDKDTYLIARHQFLRALIYGNNEHYDPNLSDILNVWDIGTADGAEHFLALALCAQLDHWARTREGEGFVLIGELFDSMQDAGYQTEQIRFAIERLIAAGMIESMDKGKDGGGQIEEVRINTTGGYYLHTLSRMFTYVDAMVVDTPIVEHEYSTRIRSVEDIDERLDRGLAFVEYLDRQWSNVAAIRLVFDWVDVAAAITSDIQDIKARSRRARKHHY